MVRSAQPKPFRSAAAATTRAIAPLCEQMEQRLLLATAPSSSAIQLLDSSPAVFVPNKGQWSDELVRYGFSGSGASIAFKDSSLSFLLYQNQQSDSGSSSDRLTGSDSDDSRSTAFSVRFPGSSTVRPVGEDRSSGRFNYLLGEQSTWRSNLRGYQTISYQNLYQGIELKTFGKHQSLKYQFHVAPGADYRQIKVRYQGIQGLSLAADGSLRVQTELGELVDDAPFIYQMIDGKQVKVEGSFRLLNSRTYSFSITGSYDPSRELVIDPDLDWSTYVGGAGGDQISAIATDADGNALVSGHTFSRGWVSGGYNTGFNGDDPLPVEGSEDAFVAKISPTGQHLWSTYLGGRQVDEGTGIAVDSAGNVLVCGATYSPGWVAGGLDTTFSGAGLAGTNGFLVKLSPTGQHLWSTYLGGNHGWASGVAVGPADTILVSGTTQSEDWVSGGYDTSLGGTDAFVAKLSASGAHIWSTYLGGSGCDVGAAVAVDPAGAVIVAGTTASAGWAAGGYDTSLGGETDAFVIKLSGSGQALWSTHVGGASSDWLGGQGWGHRSAPDEWYVDGGAERSGGGIAVDPATSEIVVIGTTDSAGWTAGGYDTSFGGHLSELCDGFVARLSASGQHVWSTYLGGSGFEFGESIAVSAAGNLIVSGITDSRGWVSGGYDTTFNAPDGVFEIDAFVAKLSARGDHLWSTYVGGDRFELAAHVALASDGTILVGGATQSDSWVSGGYDVHIEDGGGVYYGDGFLASIIDQDVSDVSRRAVVSGDARVDLSWEEPPDANLAGILIVRRAGQAPAGRPTHRTTYRVGDSLGGGTVVYAQRGTGLPDLTVANRTTYYYTVYAFNNSLDYSLGVTVHATPLAVPGAPANVRASDGMDATCVRVIWDASTDAASYEVWRSTSNDLATASRISGSSLTATRYDDTSAIPGTLYWYWVKATNSSGASPLSSPDSGYRALVPDAPTQVQASDGRYSNLVRVTWAASGGATGYEVWRSLSSNFATAIRISPANLTATSFDDTTAHATVNYWYWVRAANAAGFSPYSSSDPGFCGFSASPATVTLTSASVLSGQVELAWTNPGVLDLAGILIVRHTNRTPSAAPVNGTSYSTGQSLGGGSIVRSSLGNSYQETGLPPGAIYYYSLYAFDQARNYSAAAGVLILHGSTGDDTILLSQNQDQLLSRLNQQPQLSFSAASTQKLLLYGLGGNDSLSIDLSISQPVTAAGGKGNDTLLGGSGDDLLRGGRDQDLLVGRVGKDTLKGGGGNDLLRGSGGQDSLLGGMGDDTLKGNGGADILVGGGACDQLFGGGGADRLFAREGVLDLLCGGSGSDSASADALLDQILPDVESLLP